MCYAILVIVETTFPKSALTSIDLEFIGATKKKGE
jgi:hypothetical protein